MSDCHERGLGAWYRDGRLITNVEMSAAIAAAKRRRVEQYRQRGYCCEEGPYADGICRHGLGVCYLVREARKLEWRMYHKEQ